MLEHYVGYYDEEKIRIKCEYWKLNNEYHREDGPARIFYYKDGSICSKSYYTNGKYHREDGPAVIQYYPVGSVACEEYFINGEKYTEEEWETLVKKM